MQKSVKMKKRFFRKLDVYIGENILIQELIKCNLRDCSEFFVLKIFNELPFMSYSTRDMLFT